MNDTCNGKYLHQMNQDQVPLPELVVLVKLVELLKQK